MKRHFYLLGIVAVLTLIFMIAGCEEEHKNPAEPMTKEVEVLSGGQAGTTLLADKTATGFWEKTITYDWTIAKSVEPTSIEVCSGSSVSVTYTLSATRTKTGETDVYIVRGAITVTNGGERTTENLKLVDQVEYNAGSGQFQPLPDAAQTITPAQLGPGETGTYEYEIAFTPVPGATYRNSVKVTITNHSGHLGEEFGPEPKADFSLPNEPTLLYVDDKASISDVEVCPEGFTCTSSDPGPWELEDTGMITFTESIINNSALCDPSFELTNTAALTEDTTKAKHEATARVSISTCPCGSGYPLTGCTLTIGYWKTHAGFTGRNADLVTQYLPIWLGISDGVKSVQVTSASQAINILQFNGNASNGINKLYAQLLAAKLNIANDADESAAASVIAAADALLATHNSADWSSLSKADQKMVLGWMTALDDYNNGLIGPGHCE